MTKEQIEARVEGWNNNMNIFEIYDELRDGHSHEDQKRLLMHAYEDWDYPPMLKLLEELAYHFGIYDLSKDDEMDIITYGDKKLKEMLDNASES